MLCFCFNLYRHRWFHCGWWRTAHHQKEGKEVHWLYWCVSNHNILYVSKVYTFDMADLFILYKCCSVKWHETVKWTFAFFSPSTLLVCSALQEAQEIFGGDFDFAEFDPEAYDHAEEEEEDQEDEAWDRPKKQTKRRVGRRSIFEIYEPSELESSHMTDQDNEIRSTDMPERFQVGLYFSIKPGSNTVLEKTELFWVEHRYVYLSDKWNQVTFWHLLLCSIVASYCF